MKRISARRSTEQTTRVSLDLNPEELERVELMAQRMGHKTKSGMIRQALAFYEVLMGYHQEGYMIQAIRGGSLYQFPELDVPYGQQVNIKAGVKKP